MKDKLQEKFNSLDQVTKDLKNPSDGPNAEAIELIAKALREIWDKINGEYQLKEAVALERNFISLKDYMHNTLGIYQAFLYIPRVLWTKLLNQNLIFVNQLGSKTKMPNSCNLPLAI